MYNFFESIQFGGKEYAENYTEFINNNIGNIFLYNSPTKNPRYFRLVDLKDTYYVILVPYSYKDSSRLGRETITYQDLANNFTLLTDKGVEQLMNVPYNKGDIVVYVPSFFRGSTSKHICEIATVYSNGNLKLKPVDPFSESDEEFKANWTTCIPLTDKIQNYVMCVRANINPFSVGDIVTNGSSRDIRIITGANIRRDGSNVTCHNIGYHHWSTFRICFDHELIHPYNRFQWNGTAIQRELSIPALADPEACQKELERLTKIAESQTKLALLKQARR